MSDALVKVLGLKKHFPVKKGVFSRVVAQVRAVDGVSFEVGKQETLGLVGESGCGKTTVGRTILRLLEPTEGQVVFDGANVFDLPKSALRPLRRRMQIIFQDPYASLNPRMTVEQIVGEGLAIHGIAGEAEPKVPIVTPEQVVGEMVLRGRRAINSERGESGVAMRTRGGLQPEHLARSPHEFSGGQRQRIGIARALILNPEFVVCDEAVSALDVSIQSQILNILSDLRRDLGLTYLFIAHNLSVVQYIGDRVGVMSLGKVAELADVASLYSAPKHPYTIALLSAVPAPDPRMNKKRIVL